MKNLVAQLERRKQENLYRTRQVIDGPQGVEVSIEGRLYLSFCSNDYLGLANHPDIVTAFKRGLDSFGAGSGSAHLISGHSREHHALEEELADFIQRPRALLFSTGYMANMGVIQALTGRNSRVFEDRSNHASLIDGARLSDARLVRYRHADVDDLRALMTESKAGDHLVVTDGVFSMDGDIAPVKKLAAVATQHNAWLMVDDAHGIGVCGPQGRGTVAAAGLDLQAAPIVMGTLGKAFGTFGAFVAGSDELIETLIQQARSYVYTTATPPALASATRVALKIVAADDWRREKLQSLVARFRAGAGQLGFTVTDSGTPIQPLIIGKAAAVVDVSRALREQGILISAIRPPTVPEGTARLRITFSALHTEAHVDWLLEALEKIISRKDAKAQRK